MRKSALIGAAGLSVAVGAAGPAAAQIPPFKPLWTELRSQLASEGWTLTTARLIGSGDVWRAEGVQLETVDGRDRLTITLPALGVERSDTSLTLLPEGVLALAIAGGPGTLRAELRPDGDPAPGRDRLSVSLDGADVAVSVNIGAQVAELVELTLRGAPTGDSFSGRFGGITVDGRLATAEPFAGDLAVDVAPMSYAFASTATGPFEQAMRGDFALEGFTLRLDGAGIREGRMPSPEAAFAQGLRLAGLLELRGLRATLDQQAMGFPMRSTSALELLRIDANAVEGRFDAGVQVGGVAISSDGGPMTGAVGLQELSARVALPLIQLPQPAPFELSQALRGLTVSPQLLAMAQLGAFGDLPLTVETQMLGDLRWLRSLDAIDESDAPPVDLTRLQGMAGAALGDNTLDVQYDLTLAPGAVALMADDTPPDVTGTARVELRGGAAVLNLLAQTGLVPPSDLSMARMVMGGIGRAIGDDHLLSEIEFQPDGTVLINGLPAPF